MEQSSSRATICHTTLAINRLKSDILIKQSGHKLRNAGEIRIFLFEIKNILGWLDI